MTQTAFPIRKTDRRNYIRFLVTRILNKCPWPSQEQQQEVKDQCLDKNLVQVNQILDIVLETSSLDQQQKHRHRVNLLRCLHKSEFPVYSKQSKSPKKRPIMCFVYEGITIRIVGIPLRVLGILLETIQRVFGSTQHVHKR